MNGDFGKAVRLLVEASNTEKQQRDIIDAYEREDYDYIIRALQSMIGYLFELKVKLAKEKNEKVNGNKK